MCLAVPGKLMSVTASADAVVGRNGVVDFQGTRIEVSLAFTPDAAPGDWLLVHAGFAISRLEEDEAREIWDMIAEAQSEGGAASAARAPLTEHGGGAT